MVKQYDFKAVDGLYGAAVFTVWAEPEGIWAREAGSAVIFENCLRCHTPLVTEFVKMNINYEQVMKGEAKA